MTRRQAQKWGKLRELAVDVDRRIGGADEQDRATIRYLERVRDVVAQERGCDRIDVSKYAVAQRLGISPNRMSLYYLHGGTMEVKLAANIAQVIGENPLRVIADVEAERARSKSDRRFWYRVRDAAVVAAMAIGVASFGALPSPAHASGCGPALNINGIGIHIVRRRSALAAFVAWVLGIRS